MFIFIIIFKQYYRLHGRPYPSVSWLKSELKPEEWISGRLPPRGLSIFETPASRTATWSRETEIEEEVGQRDREGECQVHLHCWTTKQP